ncbi:uncharacterized protein LOC112877469 isoform X2 [Panicum hallii]|nr:uncharacterized protein LOC112877469 isoform X2 [Panicum hallii]
MTRAISNVHTSRAVLQRQAEAAARSPAAGRARSSRCQIKSISPLCGSGWVGSRWLRARGVPSQPPPSLKLLPLRLPAGRPLCSGGRAAMASAGWAWVAEVAGEELAKLEAAHPGRFGPLKAELERLVADPGLDAAAFPSLASLRAAAATDDDGTAPASSQPAPFPEGLICTQESSTRKRKPPAGGAVREREEGKRRRRTGTPPGGTKDRAELAIERAERCLERIRAIKRGLLAAWIH